MPPEEARYAAMREFGNATALAARRAVSIDPMRALLME
jgi:hypothetical protein